MVTVWVASSKLTLAPRAWAIQLKGQHGAVAGEFGGHVHVNDDDVNKQNIVIFLSE